MNRSDAGIQGNIESFLTFLSVERGFSANTGAAYKNDLAQFEDFLASRRSFNGDLSAIDRSVLADYVQSLKSVSYAAKTQARKIAAVRSFFKFLANEGLLTKNPTQEISAPRVPRSLPKPLTIQQVRELLDQPAKQSTPEAKRDAAMLELLYATGLRVSELVSLQISDVSLKEGEGYVRCKGKGAKERIVPLHDRAIKAIKGYLTEARPMLARDDSGEKTLFLNRRGERLTRQGFWLNLKRYAREAGIEAHTTPHTLRHSFATHMLRGGAPLRNVQELLGHAKISTTQIYTHLTTDQIRQDFDKAHPRAEG